MATARWQSSGRRCATGPILVGLVFTFGLLVPQPSPAHPLAPAFLELVEQRDGSTAVRWRTSRWRPAGVVVAPVLPAACQDISERAVATEATAHTETWLIRCPASLAGSVLGVRGLDGSGTNAIVRVHLREGRVVHAVLDGRSPEVTVPLDESLRSTVWAYLVLGVEHILFGFDHLLFVFGLLLLARDGRQLVAMVTAFTLGHSVTLALAVLGYANAPEAVVEFLIAGTILILAVEIAAGRQRASLLRRRPWMMAGGFGLLHGLGFAGALRAVGLPPGEVPLALFAFNVGIEVGQLAFVGFVALLGRIVRFEVERLPVVVAQAPVYGMGTLAGAWTIERAVELWR